VLVYDRHQRTSQKLVHSFFEKKRRIAPEQRGGIPSQQPPAISKFRAPIARQALGLEILYERFVHMEKVVVL
jgi:hypothetical protein